MKKIIFVHLLNDYSGSPKVLSQVIKAVQTKSCDVALYTGKSDDGFLSGLTSEHHHYFYKRFENKYLTLITFMLSQVSLFLKLLKYRNEDVIIYVNTMLPFGAGLAGKLMGKSVYYHIHETYVQPASFKRFLRSIIQMTASKIFFVSKSLAQIESFKSISQEVICNAVPNEFMNKAKQHEYKFKRDDKFNVLMICSLKTYKGVEEFVKIALFCEKNESVQFILLLNAEQREIDEYFTTKSIGKNIRLVSRQKNVLPFYENASLVLNLSRVDQCVETFGLTIVEAMAFGVPVIVPPVGGPTEIVRDDIDGYQISSYETKKIAECILTLVNSQEHCLKLSKNARQRVKMFNEDTFEKNICNVFDTTCS